jgi:hypothetical protein
MTRVGNLFDIRYVFSPFYLATGEWSGNEDLGVRRYKCSRLEMRADLMIIGWTTPRICRFAIIHVA